MKISFIHKWNEKSASYRYRAMIPARNLGASMNDLEADILIFCKPQPEEVGEIKRLKSHQKVIVDICDDWIGMEHYQWMLRKADAITCSTKELKSRLEMSGFSSIVIDDPYEFDLAEPHCHGASLLWFGHASNFHGVQRIIPQLTGYNLRIVSNVPKTIPWSVKTLLRELARADIVIMPETLVFKSCNRTVEAIRRGCFVVAENHISLRDIPGIWIGGIREGIRWASTHQKEANEWIRQAQSYITVKYSPIRVSNAWRKALMDVSDSTLDVGLNTGTDG